MRGSRFPSAWISRWASSSSTARTLPNKVGTITIVRAIVGHAAVEFETREHPRRDQPWQQALHRTRRQLAGGNEREERDQRRSCQPCRVRGRRHTRCRRR